VPEFDNSKPKLVRNKIPDKIRTNGETPVTEQVNSNARRMILALADKIKEEAEEICDEIHRDTPDRKAIINELGDLNEAVHELYRQLGISISEVAYCQQSKHDRLGGFDEGIILLRVIKPRTALIKASAS
jgi:predicted house-cleaning noncanonical NTP pyrophosphatase (MazG superfamily)